jgi:unsaturated rhamnogalacturonyl hydrolase
MKKLILIFLCATFSPWGYAQMAPLNVEQAVRFLADKVITTTPLEVHNHQTGISYKPGDNIPVDPYVRVRTKLSDWHYENGVMNLAMFRAGDVLQDKKYSQYTIDTYEFIFRHLPYFEKQFRDPNIPRPSFRQFFDFQYLDYCGTMGAALSETYARTGRNSAKYLETLNRVAEYILYKEFRLDDGTWCREYPRKGAVWADDLYMGTIFLSRMGKLTGDTLYFNEGSPAGGKFFKISYGPIQKNLPSCIF